MDAQRREYGAQGNLQQLTQLLLQHFAQQQVDMSELRNQSSRRAGVEWDQGRRQTSLWHSTRIMWLSNAQLAQQHRKSKVLTARELLESQQSHGARMNAALQAATGQNRYFWSQLASTASPWRLDDLNRDLYKRGLNPKQSAKSTQPLRRAGLTCSL